MSGLQEKIDSAAEERYPTLGVVYGRDAFKAGARFVRAELSKAPEGEHGPRIYASPESNQCWSVADEVGGTEDFPQYCDLSELIAARARDAAEIERLKKKLGLLEAEMGPSNAAMVCDALNAEREKSAKLAAEIERLTGLLEVSKSSVKIIKGIADFRDRRLAEWDALYVTAREKSAKLAEELSGCPNEEWECTKVQRRLEADLTAELEKSAKLAEELQRERSAAGRLKTLVAERDAALSRNATLVRALEEANPLIASAVKREFEAIPDAAQKEGIDRFNEASKAKFLLRGR